MLQLDITGASTQQRVYSIQFHDGHTDDNRTINYVWICSFFLFAFFFIAEGASCTLADKGPIESTVTWPLS